MKSRQEETVLIEDIYKDVTGKGLMTTNEESEW